MQLARFMEISDDELVNMYRGVLLHDIGKMGVPDQILRKTGPLIDFEWIEMRKHPEYAFNLLAPIPFYARLWTFLIVIMSTGMAAATRAV